MILHPKDRRRSCATLVASLGAFAAAPACCVAEGTRVRTPEGLVPIEKIGVGATVLSFDPQRQQLVAAHVQATRSAQRTCLALHTADTTLVCTPDHPVLLPEADLYAEAVLARPGRALAQVTGTRTRLTAVHRVAEAAGLRRVYDITVDSPLHNFVAEDIVVHNKDFACPGDLAQLEGLVLDEAQPERRLQIHVCRDGGDSVDGLFQVAFDVAVSNEGRAPIRVAAYFDTGEAHVEFIDGTAPFFADLAPETLRGACDEGLTLVFERLDEALDRAATLDVALQVGDCEAADADEVTIDVDA